LIAPASEIGHLHVEAERLHNEALKAMDDANSKAQLILENARADIDTEHQKLADAKEEFAQSTSASRLDHNSKTAALESRAVALADAETVVSARELTAVAQLVQANELKARYEEKLSKLNRLSAELN
jgi:hypothetical protein